MRAREILLAACALLGAWRGAAYAEPYMAVREGMPCNACHVNITGGGKRTEIVSMHPQDILHYPDFLGTFSSPADVFTGDINKYIGLGGDLRTSYTAVFQDKPNSSGRVSNDKVFRSRLESNDVEVTEATTYLEARLIPEHLTFYLDQRFAPDVNTREVWAMYRGLPFNGFVKAGRMFLPYGLQLQDDTAFIRGGYNGSANTGFSFEQQQPAFEIGALPDPFSVVFAVSDGAASDTDVQVTGTVSATLTDLPIVRSALLGGSFSRVAPTGSETVLFGFFAGTNLERLTVLGEVDFLSQKTPNTNGQTYGGFISYVEADYLLFDWMNLKTAFNYADYDGDIAQRSDDSENRFSIGLEPFLNRFVQPRLFYYIGNGVKNIPSHNQDVLVAEVHVFF